jgi:L-ribulose-5-phosphate 4-epimerase
MLEKLKDEVYQANMLLKESGLVVLTWGNVSAIDREKGLVAIKPSGVAYDELTPEKIVVVDLDGNIVEGKLKPSSDTPTHLLLYRKYENISGIAHTHSRCATSWAQAGLAIPPLGTTHADHFSGSVRCTRDMREDEIASDYEANTGKVICECLGDQAASGGAVLVKNHGPFTWGTGAGGAAENALVLEEVAGMALMTAALHGGIPGDMPQALLNKHYYRKHGKDAYYGQ